MDDDQTPRKHFTDWISSPGGYIVVCLFVFLVGVWISVLRSNDFGKEIVVGSLSSLWTAMRLTPTAGQKASKTGETLPPLDKEK